MYTGSSNLLDFTINIYWNTCVWHIKTQKHSSLSWCLSAWLHSQDINQTNKESPVCGLCRTRTWKHKQINTDVIWPHISWCCRSNSTVTWKPGWCQCCPAVGGQVCVFRGRRMEEGSPSGTGTASAASLHQLSLPSTESLQAFLPPCLVRLFQVQHHVLRMWNETGLACAERPRWHLLLTTRIIILFNCAWTSTLYGYFLSTVGRFNRIFVKLLPFQWQ